MQDIRFNGKLDYIIDNIGLVNVSRDAGFTYPYKNGKDKYSLVFVENGEMNYYFTKSKLSIKMPKDSLLFVPKNVPYIATYLKDNSIAKILIFDIDSTNLPTQFNAPAYKKDKEIPEIFKTISDKGLNNVIFLASKIYEILYIIEKENIDVPEKYKKIMPALEEIQEFYFENKKLSFYSDMCNMSESNFRRLFKEYTGKSFIEYRNLIRIFEAHKMIDSGECSVLEAAYQTGFNNMSFFYEIYNRHIK